MTQIKLSIVDTFDQVQNSNKEMEILTHMAKMKREGTVPPPSQKDDPLPPLKTFHIPKGALDNMPHMLSEQMGAPPQMGQDPVV
jgi:hypothetical protein